MISRYDPERGTKRLLSLSFRLDQQFEKKFNYTPRASEHIFAAKLVRGGGES
jgi:hypothetical protein